MELDLEKVFKGLMSEAQPDVEFDSVQYRESKRMFYAGAAAMFFYSVALAGLHLPDEEAVARLGKVEEQIMAFFQKRMWKE